MTNDHDYSDPSMVAMDQDDASKHPTTQPTELTPKQRARLERYLSLGPPDRPSIMQRDLRTLLASHDARGERIEAGWDEDALRDLAAEAYEAGCIDTHNNYQPDRSPEFGEAARDYAAHFTFGPSALAQSPSAPQGEGEG